MCQRALSVNACVCQCVHTCQCARVVACAMCSAWLAHAWYTVYWCTFVLAWLVMPIMNAAWAAGELT